MLNNVNSGNRIGPQPGADSTPHTEHATPASDAGVARRSASNHALSGLTTSNDTPRGDGSPRITARSSAPEQRDSHGGASTSTTPSNPSSTAAATTSGAPPAPPPRSPMRPASLSQGTSGTTATTSGAPPIPPRSPNRPKPPGTGSTDTASSAAPTPSTASTQHALPPPGNARPGTSSAASLHPPPARIPLSRPTPPPPVLPRRNPARLLRQGTTPAHHASTAASSASHEADAGTALPFQPHPLQLALDASDAASSSAAPPRPLASHDEIASAALTGVPQRLPPIPEQDEQIAQVHQDIAQLNVPAPTDAEMAAVQALVEQMPAADLQDPQQRQMLEAVTKMLNDVIHAVTHSQVGGVSLSDIANNNFDNTYAKGLVSMANSIVARTASVYVPTLGRQLVGQRTAEGMDHRQWSNSARSAFGTALTFVPIALLLAGAVRDAQKGRATDASKISRYALAAVGGAMMIAGLGTGAMGGAAASLAAYVLYCAMRDGVQSFVKLAPKESKQPQVGESMASGGAYAVDQMAAGSGMAYTASPSGAGAAGEPLQTEHGAERAGYNLGGEVMDDMVSNAITARGMPQLTLSGKIPSMSELADTLTGAFPGRATLFTASTILSQIVAENMTGASPATQTNINNLAVGLMLGLLLYTPFAQMGNTKEPAGSEPAAPPHASIEALPDDPAHHV
ncbi:MAG: hypothetical protein V4764_15690 [Burkholderia sp.]